jgi:hypothetical protein
MNKTQQIPLSFDIDGGRTDVTSLHASPYISFLLVASELIAQGHADIYIPGYQRSLGVGIDMGQCVKGPIG